MQLSAVDHTNHLFAITDVVPAELLLEIQNTDWASWPGTPDPTWHSGYGMYRTELLNEHPLMRAVDDCVYRELRQINNTVGKKYVRYTPGWWLCWPDYTCVMHTDGTKPNNMLLYWIVPGPDYGTTYYHSNSYDDVRHSFSSVPNTGYMVINEPAQQATHWHAAHHPVPANTVRLISQFEFLQR